MPFFMTENLSFGRGEYRDESPGDQGERQTDEAVRASNHTGQPASPRRTARESNTHYGVGSTRSRVLREGEAGVAGSFRGVGLGRGVGRESSITPMSRRSIDSTSTMSLKRRSGTFK